MERVLRKVDVRVGDPIVIFPAWKFTLRQRDARLVVEVMCGDHHRDFFLEGSNVVDGAGGILSAFTYVSDMKIILHDADSLIEAVHTSPASVSA